MSGFHESLFRKWWSVEKGTRSWSHRGLCVPLTCRPWNSLAVVMTQMISHRATHVCVSEHKKDEKEEEKYECLLGIILYVDILAAITKPSNLLLNSATKWYQQPKLSFYWDLSSKTFILLGFKSQNWGDRIFYLAFGFYMSTHNSLMNTSLETRCLTFPIFLPKTQPTIRLTLGHFEE